MRDIDWNEVIHISQWYVWKHLKGYSRILGSSDIVSEAMLDLVKTDAKKWDDMSLTTIVCNNTKWAALRLYAQHKKRSKLDGSVAFARESYSVDFSENVFHEDLLRAIASAKAKVIRDNRHNLKRIGRYKSGFLERKIINDETLDTLAASFGVTKERARQIEGRFWREIQIAMVHMYEMPLDRIKNFLINGERISEP